MAAGTIDVVVPVRNGAGTIVSSLTTVLAQSYPAQRVIVVDDGSTDRTIELISALNHPSIEVISTAPAGVSHARNVGARASRAEFVAFLDADDRWHPHKLERQIQAFAGRRGTALVYCGHAIVDLSGVVSTVAVPRLRGHVFDAALAGGFIGCSSSIMVRRDALQEAGGYDESLSFGEDTDLQLRLARRHVVDFAPDVLVQVIERPDSVTRRPATDAGAREQLLQILSIYEKWRHEPALSPRLLRGYRRRLVKHAMRSEAGRYGWRWMMRFRPALRSRAPEICRLFWRNHATFFSWLALALLKRLGRRLADEVRRATPARGAREIARGNAALR